MIKLHTNEISGLKVVCNDRITDTPVVEIDRDVKIESSMSVCSVKIYSN